MGKSTERFAREPRKGVKTRTGRPADGESLMDTTECCRSGTPLHISEWLGRCHDDAGMHESAVSPMQTQNPPDVRDHVMQIPDRPHALGKVRIQAGQTRAL